MSGPLADAIDGGVAPGVYRLRASLATGRLARDIASHGGGRRAFVMAADGITDGASLRDALARAIGTPPGSGGDWDALAEALDDLSWAPATGYVLFVSPPGELVHAEPDTWLEALGRLGEAVERWSRRGRPMHVLVRGWGLGVGVLEELRVD